MSTVSTTAKATATATTVSAAKKTLIFKDSMTVLASSGSGCTQTGYPKESSNPAGPYTYRVLTLLSSPNLDLN